MSDASPAPEPEAQAREAPRGLLPLALLLLVLTVALFGPASEFEFLNYDDDDYVTANPALAEGLTADAVGFAFGSFHAANWHPITWLSHALDVELFGLDAGRHHRTNVWLHGLAAALWFLALARLTGSRWTSFLVAAFFAVHPLRVESVAWISERKDLLAAVFWALALVAYAGFVERRGPLRYLGVALAMAASLMSKPMAVTLPFLLLVLDRWPLQRRESWTKLVIEKLPLVGLSAASAWITLKAQRAGEALETLAELPLSARIANAVDAYGTYLLQTLWPSKLAIVYPHEGVLDPESVGGVGTIAAAAALLLISAVAFVLRRRVASVAIGWLWFLGTLVPVIGLVQVGLQSHADRYTYVPGIGLAIAIGFGLRTLSQARGASAPGANSTRNLGAGAAAAGALWILFLVPVTLRQLETWRSSETVMRHAIEVTENNFVAHTNLGNALEQSGRLDEAVEQFQAALEIRPGLAPVHYSIGTVRSRQGRFAEALVSFQAALEAQPDMLLALLNTGLTLAQAGRHAEAIPKLQAAYNHPEATTPELKVPAGQAMAWIHAVSPDERLHDGLRAQAIIRECIDMSTPNPTLMDVAAAGQARVGAYEEAARTLKRALKVVPPPKQGAMLERLALYEAGKPYTLPGAP